MSRKVSDDRLVPDDALVLANPLIYDDCQDGTCRAMSEKVLDNRWVLDNPLVLDNLLIRDDR